MTNYLLLTLRSWYQFQKPNRRTNRVLVQGASLPAQSREREEQYKPGQFIICLPKSNNQADEGISLKLFQYLEPLGKAPVSEACKHLCFVYTAAKQILAKLGRMRGLTAHYPYLSLEGDSSRGAYYLVLDQAAYRRSPIKGSWLEKLWKPVKSKTLL